jgi:glucans biosynthesis protein C
MNTEVLKGEVLNKPVTVKKDNRIYYLDNLKIFITFLVIVHHVGQAYGPTGGFWQYKSSLNEIIPWLGRFFGVNAAFFMGLFFMISGYFFPASYDRKGAKVFLKDKFLRLGIPVLLAFLIIVPLEMYFYYSLYSGNKPADFLQYYANIYFGIGGKPSWYKESIGWPEMNFGHTWFLEHLLVYSVIYCIIRKLFTKRKEQRNTDSNFGYFHILSISFVIALVSAIIRIWYPIDKWIGILGFIQTEVAHLPQYIVLFTIGIVAFRKDWIKKCDKKIGYTALAAGMIMAATVYLNSLIPATIRRIVFFNWAFYESFMAVFICWGLIILFREKFNSTSFVRTILAENSYAAYIIHLPIVLTIQYSLDKVVICGASGKFIVVSLTSIIVTYSVSFLIRKIKFVRKII